jgi:hypothetical protein
MLRAFAISLALSLLWASPARAADCTSGVSCIGQVGILYVNATGDTWVTLAGGMEGITNCSLYEGYATLRGSAGNRKEIFALLLAARLAGQQVEVRFVNGTSDCEIMYVTMR